jgi:hypothetical protein
MLVISVDCRWQDPQIFHEIRDMQESSKRGKETHWPPRNRHKRWLGHILRTGALCGQVVVCLGRSCRSLVAGSDGPGTGLEHLTSCCAASLACRARWLYGNPTCAGLIQWIRPSRQKGPDSSRSLPSVRGIEDGCDEGIRACPRQTCHICLHSIIQYSSGS